MDQVTISRELLRQAAELLEGAITYDWHGNPSEEFDRECNASAIALRAALEQPAVEPVAVASIYITPDGEREFDDWKVALPIGRTELYTAPQAQRPTNPPSLRDRKPGFVMMKLRSGPNGFVDAAQQPEVSK